MAEDSLLHTTEMLKTALPYVDVRTKLTMDLLLKLFELMVSIRNFRTNDITACGFDENEEADMETLLNKIKPKCNKQEVVFVDQLLSVFQAKRMFEMYNSYAEVMNTMQGFKDFEGFEGFEGFAGGMDSDFASNIMNGFSGSDFSGMDLSSIFGGKDEDSQNDASDDDKASEYDIANYDDVPESEDISEFGYISSHKDISEYEDGSDHHDVSEYKDVQDYENVSDNNDELSSDESNEDYDNEEMFEALKAMIPPDQMEAFENLRMLFGSKSYDNNSKSDKDKE